MATDQCLANVCLHLQLQLTLAGSLQRAAAKNLPNAYKSLSDLGQKAAFWDLSWNTLLIKKGQKSHLFSGKGVDLHIIYLYWEKKKKRQTFF